MAESLSSVLDQLRAGGLCVDRVEIGHSTRVAVDGDKGGKKSGWYVVHEIRLKSGDVAYVGRFQNWKIHDAPQALKFEALKVAGAERKALAEKARAAKEAADVEREEKTRRAAERASWLWQRLDPDAGSSEYLRRKKVQPYGTRLMRGGILVVPVRTLAGDLVGLQFIQPDGAKKFLTGTPKSGAFHLIGDLGRRDPVVLCEGYATGASIHEATGWPVAVAFDAGNLLAVGRALRGKDPERELVVAGDEDHETENGNKGRALATATAAAIQARLAFPAFKDARQRTDFNDMAVEQDLDTVRSVLEASLREPPPDPPERNGAEWDFSHSRLLSGYVLIYGTCTAFDEARKRIIGLTELRAAAGRKSVDKWLNSPRRRIIEQEAVVFDPTGKSDPEATVNLFRGLRMRPKDGRCGLQLQLLHHLCNESDEVFAWVLNWLALPLQRVGSKMQTAVLFHGPEGVGKNLFFSAPRRIYGDYARVISQSDLEDKFNGWASAKLFVIGNEVVSRAELYHQKGNLKNMITEPEWTINEKHLPQRTEANHCNFVFFSNAIQPAGLDPDDRRYLIVWTPPPLEAKFYRAVKAEQAAGGVEALYHHLLQLDLEDFDEHAKPIQTQAKRELIELGMDTHQRFLRDWLSDDLPIPQPPCLTMDAYRAYVKWCHERGERNPARSIVFCTALGKQLVNARKYYSPGDLKDNKRAHFFLPKEYIVQPGQSEPQALGQAVSFFRQQLNEWVNAR